MSDIDSFIWKFRTLIHSGKNAQLDVKYEAGKATIKLTAEVDIPPSNPHQQYRHCGPAQQHQRERRAAARAAAVAEEASATSNVSLVSGEEAAINSAEVENFKDAVEATDLEAAQASEPKDEIVNEKISDEKSELSSTISIIPARRVEADDKQTEEVIKDKLAVKGVKVLEVFIQRSANGTFSRCDARIEAVQGKFIEETDFQFKNCRVIPLFGGQ